MTEFRFYHMQQKRLEQVLPEVLAKALEKKYRVVVKTGSAARCEALDAALWASSADSFLPHGTSKSGNAGEQPIWLTTEDENPNSATMLVLTDGVAPANVENFSLCCSLFDGNDASAVSKAREHWSLYKAQGHSLMYFQQDDLGKWSCRQGD